MKVAGWSRPFDLSRSLTVLNSSCTSGLTCHCNCCLRRAHDDVVPGSPASWSAHDRHSGNRSVRLNTETELT